MSAVVMIQALAVLPATLLLLALLFARRLRRLERQRAATDRAAGQALVETGELAVRLDQMGRLRIADAAQLDTARAGLDALRLMVEGQAGALGEQQLRIDAIERDAAAAVDAVQARLAELERLLANEGGWRAEVNDRLDELHKADAGLSDWQTVHGERLAAAQTALAQAQQKTAVADGVAALAGKTAARLERVDGSVQSLYTHLETFKSRIDGVERRVNDLAAWRERTDGLPDPSAPLAERVQILTGRLDAVCEVADDLLKTRAAGVRAVAAVTSLLNHLGGAAASARHALEGRG